MKITTTGFNGYSAYMAYIATIFNLRFVPFFTETETKYGAYLLLLKSCETLEEFKEVQENFPMDILQRKYTTPQDCIEVFKGLDRETKRSLIIDCLNYSPLDKDQLFAVMACAEDPNGVAYSASNIANMTPDGILDCIVDIFVALSEYNVNFGTLTKEDKEILNKGLVSVHDEVAEVIETVGENVDVRTLIPLCVKRWLRKYHELTRSKK